VSRYTSRPSPPAIRWAQFGADEAFEGVPNGRTKVTPIRLEEPFGNEDINFLLG
jgi:hypothetical protein